jgi:hypothetical protein
VAFDHEDPGLRGGAGDVVVTGSGVADAARSELFEALGSGMAVVHVNDTVTDDEHLGARR